MEENDHMIVDDEKTVELEKGGLKALLQNSAYLGEVEGDDDDTNYTLQTGQCLTKIKYCFNESMEITEDVGALYRHYLVLRWKRLSNN